MTSRGALILSLVKKNDVLNESLVGGVKNEIQGTSNYRSENNFGNITNTRGCMNNWTNKSMQKVGQVEEGRVLGTNVDGPRQTEEKENCSRIKIISTVLLTAQSNPEKQIVEDTILETNFNDGKQSSGRENSFLISSLQVTESKCTENTVIGEGSLNTNIDNVNPSEGRENYALINEVTEKNDETYPDSECSSKSIISATISIEDSNFGNDFDDDSIVDPNYTPSDNNSSSTYDGITDDITKSPPSFAYDEATVLESRDLLIGCDDKLLRQSNKGDYQNGINLISIYDDNLSKEIPLQQDVTVHQIQPEQSQVEYAMRKNYKDRKEYCIFCDKDVSHFSRHLFTWHKTEMEVQRIMSFKIKSNERKLALAHLRKQGNFVRNRTATVLRPVKRVQKASASAEEFLPCKYCLGFYKRKCLYRHTKRCPRNSDIGNNRKRQNAQSDGQTVLLSSSLFKYDNLLKENLFPHMRADNVALTAKRDLIICNYAYSYMKGRKSKGNLDTVRQNTRRLAKLLIFAQKKHGSQVKELLDILSPNYLQTILEAVNEIAKYNEETDRYESPTLAMNFGTLIKKCCDIAYIHLLTSKLSEISAKRKDIKLLKKLVESRWADEVSAQASSNLHENRWNKQDLIPLSGDIKLLHDYLAVESNKYFNMLKNNNNEGDSYMKLKELLYIQILLLNRRRPAEVAQIQVQTYKSIDIKTSQDNEFSKIFTETEKILLKTYSRFVIRGKRGRGVPVLLSPSMKEQFELILNVRDNFVGNNNYIFHTTGNSCFDGTKILYKHAIRCGATEPQRITATRLRKHLATICQLFHFSEDDLEQLSRFMGHTLKTHLSIYRMSDNMYQTAKVSKLLLLMANGRANEFIGKNLDEIDIELNPVYDNNINTFEDSAPGSFAIVNEELKGIEIETETRQIETVNKQKLIGRQRQKWSDVERTILLKYFAKHVEQKQAPKKDEIVDIQKKYPHLFKGRNWKGIKAYVFNAYRGNLKKL